MNQTSLANATQSSNVPDNFYNFQYIQDLYHKFTGKKEQLRKIYDAPYQIKFEDLETLHLRIKQVANSYDLVAQNENVTLFYDDNNIWEHSSFDRFKIQANVGNTALKSIGIEYNIAIKNKESNDFNSYKIKINIISGVAVFSEIQKEKLNKFFWQPFGYKTGKATVEYVDYMIAQNFMGVINAWFEERTKAPKRKIMDWMQSESHHIPGITKIIFLIICAVILGKIIGNQVILSNNQELAKFAIFSCVCIWLFTELGGLIGKPIERSIDKIWKIAFINLNEGDQKLIQKVRDHNKSCTISIICRSLIFIFTAVISVVLQWFLSKII